MCCYQRNNEERRYILALKKYNDRKNGIILIKGEGKCKRLQKKFSDIELVQIYFISENQYYECFFVYIITTR